MASADIPSPETSGKLPFEIFSNHLAALGKTGSGKTTAAKGFCEQLMDSGRRVCAIDPTGVWWGMRLMADGATSGYPVVIFGGDHADVPLDENSGSRLAEIIAAGSFSCVIDTSLMTVGARTRLFTDFAEALFRANKKPLHLVIDEAHVFAPQGRVPDPQSGRMLHAANNLVSGGRSRGLRIMLISQRPAKLHKDSLTQVETLISMRLIAPQDRAAVEAWIGEWADPKQGKQLISSLPSLARGEGWVWSPEIGMLERVAFPKIKTFDSSRAPEDGEAINAPGNLAAIDIDSIRTALSSKAAAEKGKPEAIASCADIEAAEKRGYDLGFKKGFSSGWQAGLGDAVVAIREVVDREEERKREKETADSQDTAVRSVTPITRAPQDKKPSGNGGAELRVLRVLAARHPARFTKAQWATLSGMKRSGGTWQTYVSRLRTAGYIEETSDGLVGVSKTGLKAAGSVDIPAPGAVIGQWKQALGSGPSKMIDLLLKAYPSPMDRANLADRVGMVATGGTFQTYLSRLKSNGLVEIVGRKVKASDILLSEAGDQAA